MTTNPNNAVGTNGAYSGRTSPNALNDVLASFTGRGILSGWACVPDSGMDVTVGGDGSHRDVAIAEDNAGNKVTVNNISQSPVSVTIPAAPANNSRIDSIVAYVENPPMGTSTDTDNPGTVGLIVVSGTVASTPVVPTDNQIRTGITADGAAGSTAYYVVLANVTVPNGITTITNTNISAGDEAITNNVSVNTAQIVDGAVTNDKMSLLLTDVSIEFYLGQNYVYTATGKLLRIGNIGRLMYNGTTGIWPSGGGYVNIRVHWPNLTMSKVLTYSCQATQSGNVGVTLKYNLVSSTNATELDTYLDNLLQNTEETFMAIDVTFTYS